MEFGRRYLKLSTLKEFMESLMKGEIQAFLEENGGKRNRYYKRDLLTQYVRHNDNKFDYDN